MARAVRLTLICLAISAAQTLLIAEDRIDYVQDVRPIFVRHCSRCHGARKQEAGLRLDAGQLIRKGSENGPVVTPGKPAESQVIARITAGDESRMPPEGDRLSAAEIAVVRRWIEQGAPFPPSERVPPDPSRHWAFQRPQRPVVPISPEKSTGCNPWALNPIDAFIAARLQDRACEAVGPASRHVLLRRVSLDLTGLPPSVEELRAFLADDSPDAYGRVVDRLLASPEYAERWARHWMDVWRYSDWYGYGKELRNSARHIWRWRDWIIESLDLDKPYSEMIVEMLAADELDPTSADRLRATGFLARNFYTFNRNVWLDSTVEHTSKAFLGLTINCARCHDHMFDPIEQADYYRFRAIFEPHRVRLDRVPGESNPETDGLARAYDADLAAPTFLFVRGNDKSPDKEHPLSPAVPAALHGPKWSVRPVRLPMAVVHPGLLPFVRSDSLAAAGADVQTAQETLLNSRQRLSTLESAALSAGGGSPAAASAQELEVARHQLRIDELKLEAATAARESLKARIAAEDARYANPPPKNANDLAAFAARAERSAGLQAAEAAFADAQFQADLAQRASQQPSRNSSRQKALAKTNLAASREKLAQARKNAERTSHEFTPLSPTYPATSSGRRLALARWIASDENPLTARVAVNHVWLRHFGKPLVPTVFDFGLNGKPATHPELLDWLALEFMRSGWSMKKLHRMIVLSAAYQRDSALGAGSVRPAAVDPDNHLLWRMNVRRLESEAVRDGVVAVCGGLDRRLGGPDLDSKQGETTYRRSIYYRHAPEKFMTFLQTFDAPSTTECYMRNETVVPQQALALSNSTLAVDEARRLAADVSAAVGTDRSADAAYVHALFERVLCRLPVDQEQSTCRDFLDRQAGLLAEPAKLTAFAVGVPNTVKGSADARQRAREDLAHVLLNHNEFVTIR